MKRRSVLWGSTAVVGAGVVGAVVFKPKDLGAPHNGYFSNLNSLLRRDGPGRPAMILDLDRVDQNIDTLVQSMASSGQLKKTYRIVVKSLPSIPLLKHVMTRAQTNALMVFHQPFLSAIADALPASDVLLGKPMPVTAVSAFYAERRKSDSSSEFDPAKQIQWLADTTERVEQYLQFAKGAGLKMRINLEVDVGLHRGGFSGSEASTAAMRLILDNPRQLSFAGLMGYEPHLAGVADSYEHPALQTVLRTYQAHLDAAKALGINPAGLTLNGAGSHTLPLYQKDRLLNDLSAGSAIVKPSDFDTEHLQANVPALFIGAPVLKHYPNLKVPGDSRLVEKGLPLWDPNTSQLYFIYGGYWKANVVSPAGMQDWLYHSTNQQPIMGSKSVDLGVDDYLFFRPTQSEHVMLQFGDLLAIRGDAFVDRWPVFHQTA